MSKSNLPAAQDELDFYHPTDVPESFKKAIGVVQVAMGSLGFLHRKCFNVAVANAYEGLGQGKRTFRMTAADVSKWVDLNSHNYQALYDTFEELRSTPVKSITFDKTEAKKGHKRRRVGGHGLFSDFAIIEGGIIEYSFSESMAEILHEPEQFIWMSLSVQNRFSRKYELNLFENCIRYANVGTTGFKSVEDWRQLLGATEPAYDQFKHLNQLVLKPAAKGVNSVSGIVIEPEFEREKRKVTGIKYTVRENEQMSLLEHRKHAQWRALDVFKKAKAMGQKEVEIFYWLEGKGEEYLAEVLDYVAERKPRKNVSGYLADGLRKGWGVKSPAERAKIEKTRKRAIEHQAAHNAKKTAERAEEALALKFLAHQQARIEALLKGLSDKDLTDVTAEMSEDIAIPAVAQKWAAIGSDISRMGELPKMVHRTMFDRLKKSVLGRWGDKDDLDFEAFKKKSQEN